MASRFTRQQMLDREFDRFERRLPDRLQRPVRWLRKPSSVWVRIPLGLIFIAGGFLGFLPILGFWMLPLGVLLLAEDIPFLRSPVRRLLVMLQRWWDRWRR